ncbi:prepilin-type N-terminal cleavage/methylation domain-containing protein [Opitutaceae bacterium TAV4]|nr:prepilin-type N-terminal cleavage/methylation domain-containing protein [Opitutaceae bacterium TAV4]RRJ98522.1 prepilin-type N-terminal cleavage/methylation domain-containing protein [Opitutaceae bacterium TAV3]
MNPSPLSSSSVTRQPLHAPLFSEKQGFTLIELLVVIAIIGILAGIAFPVFQRARRAADRAATTNSLRQIGSAIQLYTNDYKGRLPGPLWTYNFSWYSTGDNGTLGYHLWSYLNIPQPTAKEKVATILTNPANTRYRQDSQSPVYGLRDTIPDTSNPVEASYPTLAKVFGQKSGYDPIDPAKQPKNLSQLADYPLSRIKAIWDVDQKNVSSSQSRWPQLPPEPVLGNIRMALFFDWHVAPLPVK